jgi:hypothetical protein
VPKKGAVTVRSSGEPFHLGSTGTKRPAAEFSGGGGAHMSTISWRVSAVGTVILVLAAGPAAGQPPLQPAPPDDLKARVERLEQQNQALLDRLQNLGAIAPATGSTADGQPGPDKLSTLQNPIASEEQRKRDAERQEAEKRQKEIDGYVIGTELGMTARWRPESGLWFETPNKDFTMHMGMWMQWDTASFTQSAATLPANQLGNFQDGTYFRRVRPFWEGTAYDTIEWNLILALEQTSVTSAANGNGQINLDEFWAGIYDIPWIGRIRVGHMKVPQGLEGNQMSSSRAMTFQENSAYTDAFYRVFGTGVEFANTAFDKRMTWQGWPTGTTSTGATPGPTSGTASTA